MIGARVVPCLSVWRTVRIGGLACVLAAFLLLSVACGPDPGTDFAAVRGDDPYSVLLVTIDTIRADRVGAYGFPDIDTPVMDALAAGGVRFAAAYGPTPLTLPSHVSLMTGTYPMHHGVRDNGAFVAAPELDTLAELLAARGYRTGAFVGAWVLDGRWGLDQGFSTYFDEFEVSGQSVVSLGGVQRPADEVVDAAIDWLGPDRDPFFLWVHLYDPHAPYEPPEPYRSRYPERPYLGEIAFADAQLGRLLEYLESTGRRRRTFVAVAGDHGESLGEHGEERHGLFVYEEAIRVPLIVATPFEDYRGVVRSEPVSLVDVAPTLLEMAGVGIPEVMQGVSLVERFAPGTEVAERPVYAESWYGRLHYGWSELEALVTRRYKLIDSSEPELYDLVEDPEERENLAGGAEHERLRRRLEALSGRWARGGVDTSPGAMDEDTRRRLAALGYLGGSSAAGDGAGAGRPSPRSRLDVYNRSIEARAAIDRGDTDRAEALLLEILAGDDRVVDAHRLLGELYLEQGRHQEAAEAFRTAMALRPDDPYIATFLFEALAARGELAEAERALEVSLEAAEPTPMLWSLLGDARRAQGDLPGAQDAYRAALRLDPGSATAHAGLAVVARSRGDLEAAAEHARRALAESVTIPGAHFVLARVAEARGDLEAAVREYEAELAIVPEDVAARFNLAMIHRRAGRDAEERRALRRVLETDPDHPAANLFMARSLLGSPGGSLAEARAMVRHALEQPLSDQERALAFYLMGDLANREGDPAAARVWLDRAEEVRARLEGQGQ